MPAPMITLSTRARFPRRAALVAATAIALVPALALAAPLHFGPRDNTSLFTIAKSENRNQVVYAIHLDDQCSPVGDAPVFAFWRMNEKGPNVIEPLLSIEEKAYGIDHQRVLPVGGPGGKVEVALRAMPSHPVTIETKMQDGRCEGWSTTTIAGQTAFLYNVYVKISGFHAEYILLSGWALDRSHVLHEQLNP